MALLKFLKGNYSNLTNAAIAEGQVLICGDTGEMFVDVAADKRVKIGDFVVMSDIAALEALDASAVPTSRLYYVEAGNILARSNGTEWVQINKQKTLAQLGGVSQETYNTKIAALEKADTDNATAISGVDTRLQAAEKKLESVATTEGLDELTDRVTTAEGEIDDLQAAIAEGGSVANAIADAKKAGTDAAAAAKAAQDTADAKTTMAEVEAKNYATQAEAQGYANAKDAAIQAAQAKADSAYELAEGKATMDQVNTAIANAGHAVKADVDTAIENLDKAYKAADTALETKLQGNIDKKVDQTAYDTKVAELEGTDEDLQDAIDALAGKVGEVPADKTIVQMIADAKTDATYDDTKVKEDIKANADAIDAIEADYLKKADKDELQGNIDTLTGVVETLRDGIDAEKVDGVKDLIAYVDEHGAVVTGMQEAIAANTKAIADQATADAAAYETKTDAAQKLVDAKAYADVEVGKDRERLAAIEGKVDVEKVSTAISTAVEGEKARAEAKEAELAAADATNLQAAKDYADDAVEALGIGDYIKKADADAAYATAGHDHDDEYDAKGAAAAAETAAKGYADGLKNTIDAAYTDADAALKTELQGEITSGDAATLASAKAYADEVKAAAIADAKADAANKDAVVLAEAQQGITAVQTALDTYKTDNNAEIAKKANAADVYAKTETYTQAEVDALIAAASTWGNF